MRSRLYKFAVLVLVVCAVSCSDTDTDLKKLIPADAVGVMSLDVRSVLAMADISPEAPKLPATLKSIVRENDQSPLCQVLSRLPNMGLNCRARLFAYMPSRGVLKQVVLVPLDDAKLTRNALERIVGGDFVEKGAFSALMRTDCVFAITGNTLLVARLARGASDDDIDEAVTTALTKTSKSATGDSWDLITDTEHHFAAAFNADAIQEVLGGLDGYSTLCAHFPIIQLFTESDVERFIVTGDCAGDSVRLDLTIEAQQNCDYLNLMSTLLAAPDAHVLGAIPASMDYIGMISVKGEAAMRLPQVEKLIEMFGEIRYVGRMDIKPLISTIDGPVAVGLSRDPHLTDVWNIVLAARSNAPRQVINYITDFGSKYGQTPWLWQDELLYEWDNKMVRLSTYEDIVYVKMLDYEQTEGSAYENNPLLRNALSESVVAGYINVSDADNDIYASWIYSMPNPLHGSLLFRAQHSPNSSLELLRWLASLKPAQQFE